LWWLKGDVVFGKRMHVQGGRVFEMAGREVGDRSGDGQVVDLVATDADADADRGVMWIGRRRERTPGNGC